MQVNRDGLILTKRIIDYDCLSQSSDLCQQLTLEKRQQVVYLLPLSFFKDKAEPAGRVPPDAILFVQAATKKM
jgi:hypothetical protein